jgi:Kef-type K+ transport system membrane component KefB
MIPRGEVGIIVASVGLSLGIIQKDLYSVIIFMSIITTVLAPPILKSLHVKN